jgi:hypothetical protein
VKSSDLIEVRSNVSIIARERGKIVDRREGHNVFVNQGRQWLRNIIGASRYPVDSGSSLQNLTSNSGEPAADNKDTYATGTSEKTYRVRFVGLGIGGSRQTITPPGVGAQVEEVSIIQLEHPVKVSSTRWLKQILPQPDFGDTLIFPNAYTIRFRSIFDYNDVSFPSQVESYGTNVPVSEIGLYTSEAPSAGTISSTIPPGSTGFIAYNIFAPISKTPNFVLEISWELRF